MKQFSLPAALLLGSSVAVADIGTTLSPVVVTATRTAQTADETLASVTVITREDIERSQAQLVPEILRGVPGLTLTNTGGPGKETSIFMRGTNSDHVLVLIDGIKVGSATTGKTAIQDLPLDQIERIEVVRGPRSSLYGSEAIGGVIQIFTRKGGGDLTPRAALTLGSHDTVEGSFGLTGGGDQGWFNLGLDGLNTDGFNACDPAAAIAGAGCFADEPDKDGYRNRSASLRMGRSLGADTDIELHWLRIEAEVEYDGFFNKSETEQQVIGGRIETIVTDNWDSVVQVGRSWDNSDNFSDFVPMSRFDTRRDNVSWQNNMAINGLDLLTLGLDYQNDKITSTEDFDETQRYNWGAFVQYQLRLGQHDIIASLRGDDNEQFGDHTTGSLAWGYDFANDLRWTASYGTAFKAPSFNDLYWPEDPVFGGGGNPDLKPEKSKSLEFGLSAPLADGSWSVNVYRTHIDDLKDLNPNFTPVNVDTARIHGLETVVRQNFKGWSLNGSLTLLDTEDRETGNELRRRPRQILQFDADRTYGRFSLGGSLHVEGRRYEDKANETRLGGFGLVDLHMAYVLEQDVKFSARIANLFDQDYETAQFFNQDGRTVFVTISYQPR